MLALEASKGGTKVGRMKDPLYKDSYLGITPPTFILPFEGPESLQQQTPNPERRDGGRLEFQVRKTSALLSNHP